MKLLATVVLSLILCTSSFAQINIEFPYSRLVFQQNALGNGEFLVSGYSVNKADSIQARLLPFAATTGEATEWVTCRTFNNKSQFNFSTLIKAAAGWYNLQVRAMKDSAVVADTTLSRVGIGEVFVVAGQSNAQGQTSKEARSSKDPYERVGAFSGYDEEMDIPSFKAEQLNSYISIYPVGATSWCWAELGDKIAKRLNVPVFFLNTAWGGTGSQDWADSVDSSGTFVQGRAFIPYGYLQRTIQFYRNIIGFRAVLWHQGESDAYRNYFRTSGTAVIDYFNNMQRVIMPSRKQAGKDLAWVISQTSLIYGITDSLVLNDQRKLVNEASNIFAGPYTDTLTNARFDGVHFTNEFDKRGLTKLASAWDEALDSTFFKKSVPTLPYFRKDIFVLDSGKVLIPAGFKVKEIENRAAASFKFLTDESGNYYVSPLLPCGKKNREFREQPRQGSFNEVTGDQPAKLKVLVMNERLKNSSTEVKSRKAILLKPGFIADSTTTFTIEVDGCY